MDNQWEEINPQVWKATAPGDSIEGRLIAVDKNVGPNNSTAYHLENTGGNWLVWGTTILDDRMNYCRVGDYVRITFKELKKNARNQDLKVFKVERKPETIIGSEQNLE